MHSYSSARLRTPATYRTDRHEIDSASPKPSAPSSGRPTLTINGQPAVVCGSQAAGWRVRVKLCEIVSDTNKSQTWARSAPACGISKYCVGTVPSILLCTASCRKDIPERPKELPLRRPICDGEDNLGERSVKIGFQSLTKINSGAPWVIRESATTPCAKN